MFRKVSYKHLSFPFLINHIPTLRKNFQHFPFMESSCLASSARKLKTEDISKTDKDESMYVMSRKCDDKSPTADVRKRLGG